MMNTRIKKIAILQSNYIPWKGYFDLINMVDEFIIYDDAQYTKNDWRNRNRLKTSKGLHWLTIPVRHDSLSQKIKDTQIADPLWAKKHLSFIEQSYRNADAFKDCHEYIKELYLNCRFKFLSDINYYFITEINKFLGINTKLNWSSDYGLNGNRTERLLDVVQKAGGTEYVSGPAAKTYLQKDLFEKAGIQIRWMDYSWYKEYPQLHPPFKHEVSIIDLMLNVGTDAVKYMKSFQ